VAIEQGGSRRSYGALNERVVRLAAALHGKGVRYGDRIGLLSENRAEYIEIELAAAYLGAIVACQNWRLAAAELQHCLDLVSPALVIASRRFAQTLSALRSARRRKLHQSRMITKRWCKPPRPLAERPDVDPEDGLVILYTSGTTGLPKAR
jgi:Acyl-CoA synthetases (AMP-forming)/AMP-acid ligases II